MKKILIFDTETTGLPLDWKKGYTDVDNWPRIIQCAWSVHLEDGTELARHSHMITPPDGGFVMEAATVNFHAKHRGMEIGEGETWQQVLYRLNDMLHENGKHIAEVMATLVRDMWDADVIVAHNYKFDDPIVRAEILRFDQKNDGVDTWMDIDYQVHEVRQCPTKADKQVICTMLDTQKIFGKWPKLPELYHWLHGRGFENAHDAGGDVAATVACLFKLLEKGHLKLLDKVAP